MITYEIKSLDMLESNLPFAPQFINLPLNETFSDIPFCIGGATQQGVSHIMHGYNNQDSMNIIIDDDFIAGIVCDGCTSSDDMSRSRYSHNEIGSKIYSLLFSSAIKTIFPIVFTQIQILSNRKRKIETIFLTKLTSYFYQHLKKMINVFDIKREDDKRRLIFDFFMTTMIGFIVTKEKYIVFGWGDGVTVLNGDLNVRNENSGDYFADNLLEYFCKPNFKLNYKPIKLIKMGSVEGLNQIFIATDGFKELAENHRDEFISFLTSRTPKTKKADENLDYPIIDLRQFLKGIEPDRPARFFKDDASFILLTRKP